MNNFAVFILTHGRPNKVTTYRTLIRQGYTGDIYIIVDNEDVTIDEYRKNFGDKVIVFDKAAIAQTFDEAGIFEDRRAVVYARNASFQIAKDLGLDYFLQLDDDYRFFVHSFTPDFIPVQRNISNCFRNLDKLFQVVLDFLKSSPRLTCLALAQGGDFMGGVKTGAYTKSVRTKRKAMNTFFCVVDRPFQFIGRINEDVNTYTSLAYRGLLFLTIMQASINQKTTQTNSGGMTELYLNSGTYIKSFYTVMMQPSSVHIFEMGSNHKRLHHWIDSETTFPKILSETHKKK